MEAQTEMAARINAPPSRALAVMGKEDKCQFAKDIAGTVGTSHTAVNNAMMEIGTTETAVITSAILNLVGNALTLASTS